VESQWKPQTFTRDLAGVKNAYDKAKLALALVLVDVASLAEQSRAIAAATQPADAMIANAGFTLAAIQTDFDKYVRAATAATNAAAGYMRTITYLDQDDEDVFAAIEKLPIDLAGVKATRHQLVEWEGALGAYGSGADFIVAQQTFIVTAARETHDALETAIQVGGVVGMSVTGAQLLLKGACEEFAKFAIQQVVSLGVGVAVSYASQNAIQLVSDLGLPISPDALRIGADSIQLISLLCAARAERQKMGANCFVAGTDVLTAAGGTPIEQLHVGDRVLTQVNNPNAPGAPQNATGDPNTTAVDPATWRHVTLDMPDPQNPGNDYQMQLLEPLSWISSENALAGAWVDLSLPELGISGNARVETISPCPTIQGGNGRVVLGMFEHVSHDLVDVNLQGEAQPLQVTAGHKLWSLDAGGWVQAGQLHAGERLATEHGEATVASVAVDVWAQTVYNLDVESDHRYFVTDLGIVAHNASPCNPYIDDLVPQVGTRITGVRRATALEIELVQRTGKGTGPWTAAELTFIKNNGALPPGTVGHHINSVVPYADWAGDPRNIAFVRGQSANFNAHGQNWQNPTTGQLIDRQAMLDALGGQNGL